MIQNRLRVYYGPPTDVVTETIHVNENTVEVPLGEILPLLVDAYQSKRTWLKDFANEAVTISTDLHEVVLAYQHHRRPSA
jgi:hypothetical protein